MPGWRWVLCALLVGVAAGVAVPAYGAINGSRWTIPSDYSQEMSFDGTGDTWLKGYFGKIYNLDPVSSALTTWSHQNGAILGSNHYGTTAETGSYVWSTSDGLDHVNRLDTSNGQLVSWPFPASTTCDIRNLALDGSGNAWYGKTDKKVAKLDPVANTITEWPIDANGKVWFCETAIDKIGFLDPGTGSVTEWTIAGNAFVTCNPPNASGQIWFARTTPEILRLDTGTNQLNVWACQMGCTTVNGVSREQSAGKVWFTDGSDVISFNSVSMQFIEYTGLSCSVSVAPYIDPAGHLWTLYLYLTICRFPSPP
jgi:streptogramin lyase